MPATSQFFKTEDLAYWFFRLNGCLCLVNFLVHHEQRGQEGTDVDVMAVRFPYRNELGNSLFPIVDHRVFSSSGKIDLIISEVKLGLCNLNGPWTKSERGNMQRVLYAMGAFQDLEINRVASDLYNNCYYEDENYRFRLFAIGRELNTGLAQPVIQLTWAEIAGFIWERFTTYERYKTQHRQWDPVGQELFIRAIKYSRDSDMFIRYVTERLQP